MLVPSTTYFHSTSFYIYVYQDCERNTVEKFRRLTQPLSLMRLLVKDTETRRRILARDMVPVQSDSVCYSIYITTLIYKLTLPYRRKLVSLTKYQYVPARQSFFFFIFLPSPFRRRTLFPLLLVLKLCPRNVFTIFSTCTSISLSSAKQFLSSASVLVCIYDVLFYLRNYADARANNLYW